MRIRHHGLKALFEDDIRGGVSRNLEARCRLILSALNAAEKPSDMDQPAFKLHQLKGDRKGTWSAKVNKNWRITFKFVRGDATDVDLEDYH
jgi:proteic killer suppression protein